MDEKTIELLCEKLGITVEYLIPKAQAYGIRNCIALIVICCLFVGFEILYIRYLRNKYKGDLYYADEVEIIFAVTGGVLAFILLIIFVCSVPELIMWITAPEVGLLKLIK